jgi:hypothetical protein
MMCLVCPDGAIGDPHAVAITLPDLAADAARQKRLRRKFLTPGRPADMESLLRIRSGALSNIPAFP